MSNNPGRHSHLLAAIAGGIVAALVTTVFPVMATNQAQHHTDWISTPFDTLARGETEQSLTETGRNYEVVTAWCEPGEVVVSGGYSLEYDRRYGTPGSAGQKYVKADDSRPTENLAGLQGWRIQLFRAYEGDEVTATAIALCGAAGP